jgi:Domain of unknown function (DUF4190)
VNSLAVAALVCALIPGVPSAAAIVTGAIAHRQIQETGERGAGLATAGILLGALSLMAFLLYLVGFTGI